MGKKAKARKTAEAAAKNVEAKNVEAKTAAAEPGPKHDLRAAILAQREQRHDDNRYADDETRTKRVTKVLKRDLPRVAAAYLSTGAEPGTFQLVAWLAARGVRVLLPVLSKRADGGSWREPAWAVYEGPEQLQVGPFGILEPNGEPLPGDAIATADLVLCPGLAGTPSGERLGRGGGWYDRALPYASSSARVWMLLNDDEVVQRLSLEAHDRRVDAIVTPTEFIDCTAAVGVGRS